MSLVIQIEELRKSDVRNVVEQRLKEFKEFENKTDKEWFCELCFCLLTANSRAQTAINIQNELGADGFLDLTREEITEAIKRNKHRFHNNKARYIVEARKYKDIRSIIKDMDEKTAREWLAVNIKGLGYKEASHFLRNTGGTKLAILDRHILNLFLENGYLIEKPSSLNRKKYLEIEEIFNKIAELLDMNSSELDLYMWYLKTGEVLK